MEDASLNAQRGLRTVNTLTGSDGGREADPFLFGASETDFRPPAKAGT